VGFEDPLQSSLLLGGVAFLNRLLARRQVFEFGQHLKELLDFAGRLVCIDDLGWAEVTASSLFEAVAQGLSALRKNEWVEGIEERFGVVKVSVADVRVEHQVKIADFMKWLERPGRTLREITQRQKIRAILGMSMSR